MNTFWNATIVVLVMTAGELIGAGMMGTSVSAQPLAGAADIAPAPGDRVALDSINGLKGVVIKIGGAGDPSYYLGCYGIHFDYETSDPGRIQWTCTSSGSKVFKLGNIGGPPAPAQPIAVMAGAAQNAPPVNGFAVGDRIIQGSLKGIIVKIGGAGDPSYYQGCVGVHFDYETSDPQRVQWSCPPSIGYITKIAAGAGPAIAAAPAAGPAAPNAVQAPLPALAPGAAAVPIAPAALPPPQIAAAQPAAPSHYATPPDQPGQGSANVQSGKYECYGAIGAMGGYNFSITGPAGYSDIAGTAGSYSMAGGMLTFHGGAHDGESATFFPGPDARNPPHITFVNTLGGGLGISCDNKP